MTVLRVAVKEGVDHLIAYVADEKPYRAGTTSAKYTYDQIR